MDGDTSSSSLIAQNCFSDPGGFLCFHMKLKIVLSISVKNCIGILMGIALNLCIAFGRMPVFTLLILLIHEQGRFFPLSYIFLNFFFQCLKVLII